jgi:hypothetical protein
LKPRVFFLVTVDGDLRIGTPAQQESAVLAIRGVHGQQGLLGRTTWMINELDFHWTEQHPGPLLELAETGESIGIHDHLETHHAFTYSQAKEDMHRSKSAVEKLLLSHGYRTPISMHRNGCGFQSEIWYDAQSELGYHLVSDVWPEKIWSGGMLCDGAPPSPWRSLEPTEAGAIAMDNRVVPLTALPWRHGPANWLDFRSKLGHFLQVPITSMPSVDRQRFEDAAANGQPVAFLLLDTHPYDMQDPSTGDVSSERIDAYRDSLVWVMTTFGADPIRLDEVEGLLPS